MCTRLTRSSPTLKGIKYAIIALLNNKAAGVDSLPAEFFKAQPSGAANMLHSLRNDSETTRKRFRMNGMRAFSSKLPKREI